MEDVNISKFRAQVVRSGSTPASPGFVVSEGQNPVDPSGSGQNHLPVTIATAATGLSITESQILSGAGTVGQYIRGDGSLADFPATTGGGSSVSYYLNGSVSQGTIGGVAYLELNKMPVFGAGTDITRNSDGYIASFITDAGDPNKLLIPAGNWNLETYFSASSNGGSPSFYVELYKYNGTTFTLIASSSSAPELIAFGTNLNPYFSTLAVPETVLALTDRLALRYYVNTSGRTITLHTENNHLCQVITTFTTGLTALNGLTSQVQFFAVGTSGTDFAISSATDTHTFNLPTASATNRGALSSADWTTFNNKQNALTNPVTGTGTSGQVAYFTGTSAISSESNLFWDATNDRLGITTNTPTSKLAFGIIDVIGEIGRIGFDVAGNQRAYIAANRHTATGQLTDLSFGVMGNEAMRLFSDGNLLVGSNTFKVLSISDAGGAGWATTGGASTSPSIYLFGTGTSAIVQSYINNVAKLEVSNTGISVNGTGFFSGNITLTNGANRYVRIGSSTAYYYDLQTTGDDFQIIEAGTTPRLTFSYPTGNATFSSSVTASSIIKSGGTSSQYLMADGSVSTLTNPVTGTGTTNYLPKFTGASTIGNSQIFDTGSEVRIFTTSTDARNFTLGVYGVTWDNTLLEIANEVSVFNKTSADNGDIIGFRTVGLQRGDIRASATDFTISSRTNLILGSNNTGQMTLNASGNLLVGTTTDAGFKLDVNGTGRFSSSLTGTQFIASGGNNTTVFNSTSATTGWVQIGMNNTSGSALLGVENSSGGTLATGTSAYSTVLRNYTNTDLQIATNNIVRTTITSGGNVGIGTASPTLPIANRTGLVIRGGSNGAELNLQSTSATDGTSVGFALVGFSTDAFYINRLDGNHIFVTGSGGNTERMRITSGGSVGINNTSPMNSAWGTDITTKQLSIDASAYAVINLTGSTSRKYSMGVGDGNFYMCYDNTAARHNITVSSGGNVLINTTTSGASKLRIVGLPTSSAGLSSGDVWSDSGTLKIA